MSRVKNVSEWLDETAQRVPNKIAFSDGLISYTFGELKDKALRIGSELARRSLFKKPITVIMPKDPRMIAVFLGCAYSGNFYIPIDVDTPIERINKINLKSSSSLTITPENYSFFSSADIDLSLLQECFYNQIDTDLLYVLFTSGSTGEPKGVAIQHRSLIEYIYRIRDVFSFGQETRFAQQYPLVFDASIVPIYQTIINGSTDFLIPKKTLMFPSKIIDFFNTNRCNTFFCVPTGYSIIANSGIFKKKIPEFLDKCLFSGEVMSSKVLNIWKSVIPNAQFANIFGPTEITDTFLYYIVDRDFPDDSSIPIGKKYLNTDVLILNDNNKLCSIGEVGELCVRGTKLSCGYYNDPEKTSEVFVQNPLNNSYPEIIYRTGDLGFMNEYEEIMFVGRKDFQIKHAGHRIELGEIEAVVNSLEHVDLCACIYDKTHQIINLFYSGLISENDLKSLLKLKLQQYMIPGKIYKLESLPRTPNGKISRVELSTLLSHFPPKSSN